MKDPRQAIVVIHGIGEQRPMTTLRGFVEAVLKPSMSTDALSPDQYYSAPDVIDDTFELRRLVAKRPRRTDFYEFYWAHLMPTAPGNRIAGWFWLLMFRRLRDIPPRLVSIWLVSWIILLAFAVSGLLSIADFFAGHVQEGGPFSKAPWAMLALVTLITSVLRSYVGDAAVYLSPAPANIEARRKIRAAGLALVKKLQNDARYDRIVIVGHSLGSVIGYDLISLSWQALIDDWRNSSNQRWLNGEKVTRRCGSLIAAEKYAKSVRDGAQLNIDQWQKHVRANFDEIRADGRNWKISDFITLGSPLAHGDVLLADNCADFGRRKAQRELPTSPPFLEEKGLSYYHRGTDANGKWRSIRIPHHAAPFLATNWTNLHFGNKVVFWGDLVGGPVAPLFGEGVDDRLVSTKIRKGWLAHTLYWSSSDNADPEDSLNNVKSTINLHRVMD